ncbi:MAG: outer membrane protein assembly factor BamA [Planctomycetes bacterium]|nr:outer membrane protein assembly factor BamA [Planctomycetota bacterium]
MVRQKATHILIAAVLSAWIILPAAECLAGPPPSTIAEVNIKGNTRLSQQAVLELIKTRPGQVYNPAVVDEDFKRLLASGKFDSVTPERTTTDKGVVITFTVVERTLVTKLVFQGNKTFKTEALAKELNFGVGDPLSRVNVENGAQNLLAKFKGSGFLYATVTYDKPALEGKGEVIYRIVEGPRVTISRIKIVGNTYHTDLYLLVVKMSTKARFWPFVKGYIDTDVLESDLNSIRNTYVSEGFLDCEVDRILEPAEDKNSMVLKVVIKEGLRYKVESVKFAGNTVFSNEQLSSRIKLKKGVYLEADALKLDTEIIEYTYGELGYIFAKIRPEKRYPRPGEVTLIFNVTESDQYTVGRITIKGNDVTQEHVIRRELRFFQNQLYNRVAVEESKRRLFEGRLFQSVDIDPVGTKKNVRDVLVTVKEGKTAEFQVGVGYSTNTGFLGTVSYTQRNFNILGWPTSGKEFWRGQAFKGNGETLSITAEPGVQMMRFTVDWFTPYIFDLPYSGGAKAFVFSREREVYDELRYGGVFSLGKRFKNRWYGELALNLQQVDIRNVWWGACKEIREDEGAHFMPSLKATIVRDKTDSRWLPTTGDRLSTSYEQFVGSDVFGRISADYHVYRTLYTDVLHRKHVLAGRAAIGQIVGDAPTFERFYGGGLGSVRGFRYRGIGPRGVTDLGFQTNQPIGGKFMMFLGTEYTFPLVSDVIRGAMFIDTGTVEPNMEINTYRVSAGFGLRWTIPFFGPVPMSLDFGFPLVKDSEQDNSQLVNFTVGWTF